MYKTVLIAFLVCFFAYLPFSRRPDYFDGVFATGKVVLEKDTLTGMPVKKVVFRYGKQMQSFDPSYLMARYDVGAPVKVIYEEAHPENASVYRIWGYWVRWKEILSCIVIYFGLLQLSVAITKNPDPEAAKEQEAYFKNPPKRTKYNGNTF